MERAALALDITGHRDGYAVWFADCVVDVFPTLPGAVAGFHQARWAVAEPNRILVGPERAPQ